MQQITSTGSRYIKKNRYAGKFVWGGALEDLEAKNEATFSRNQREI